jgi:hypothetical protein
MEIKAMHRDGKNIQAIAEELGLQLSCGRACRDSLGQCEAL